MKTISYAIIGSLVAMSASATLYVDYNLFGSVSVSRDADFGEGSVTNNGDVWTFSDTTALAPSAGGQNDVIYGGVITSWSVESDYNPTFQHQSNGFQLQIGDQGGTQAATGTYVWKQEDFLNGGDTGTISLGTGSSITINLAEAGATDYRAVVNQGGSYYVSQSVASDTADATFDLTATDWATLNTADYSYGTFSALTLDDVQSVGVWFDQSRNGLTRFRVQDFQLNVIPEPATLGLVAAMGAGILFIRRRFMM